MEFGTFLLLQSHNAQSHKTVFDRGIEIAQQAKQMPVRFTDIERRLPYRENVEHTLGLAYLKKGSTSLALNHLRKAMADQPNRQFLQDDLQRALELTADTE